jgi:hypothetical protein
MRVRKEQPIMTSSSLVPTVVLDVPIIILTAWTFKVGRKMDDMKQDNPMHEIT